jgi:hypothetical protein
VLQGHHTAERISEAIKSVLDDMHPALVHKLSCVTVDGASNVRAALKEFGDAFGVWCFCHIINLAVRDALKVGISVTKVENQTNCRICCLCAGDRRGNAAIAQSCSCCSEVAVDSR